MTNTTPIYTPSPRVVIAKIEGDTQVMQYEYLARTGKSDIDHLRQLCQFREIKQAHLVAIEDKTSTAALKAQMWITAIEGKIADAEMGILEYFEEREATQPAPVSVDVTHGSGYMSGWTQTISETDLVEQAAAFADYVRRGYTFRVSEAVFKHAEKQAAIDTVTSDGAEATFVIWSTPRLTGMLTKWAHQIVSVYAPTVSTIEAAPQRPAQDDIVTRVYALHAQREGVDTDMGIDGDNMELMLAAVDTIRALRAEVEALQIDIETLKTDKQRLTQYREATGEIVDELMGIDLSDTHTVGNLINSLWRLR